VLAKGDDPMVRVEQRMDNHLQRCNIRFSNYVSNQGKNVSIRKVIRAIIAGERDLKPHRELLRRAQRC
jgi:hypothetical protein